MDNKSEVAEFLPSRRVKITPAQAGLPDFGAARRVVGPRREEAALQPGSPSAERFGLLASWSAAEAADTSKASTAGSVDVAH